MSSGLDILKSCELHVHLGGCLSAEDLLRLGREVYPEVDWELFTRSYEESFGTLPDPVALFAAALEGGAQALHDFRRHWVFSAADGADFARFQAKFNLFVCLYRHWQRVLGREEEIGRLVLERHRAEGLRYVEYRAMAASLDPEDFLAFHRRNARLVQEASGADFEARYIISLPRRAPLEGYTLVRRLLDQNPELRPAVVGLDFCAFEEGFPPRGVKALFERLRRDEQQHPEEALEVVYHVGESFFDKSLESAVRWCHEAAELGARRLGHAIALGLDPEVALARRPGAHEREGAGERLDQIEYDLEHCEALRARGIAVAPDALRRERTRLERGPAAALVERPYAPERLEEVRRRQDFALERLGALGAVVECCPTSNLRLGGLPGPARHPLHRFLDSEIGLVIGADDPGMFNSTLADEVDWVVAHAALDKTALLERLGDPRRFALKEGPARRPEAEGVSPAPARSSHHHSEEKRTHGC